MSETPKTNPFLVVLGVAQDAGFPQAGCRKKCCAEAWRDPQLRRFPACVAVVDPVSDRRWFFDCTPSFPEQLYLLEQIAPSKPGADLVSGIFLTHAHVGHYAGLIHLGTEAMNSCRLPLYVMPRMAAFLRDQAPWSLLVESENVELREIEEEGESVTLSELVKVRPFPVPHRGPFSETVAFLIEGAERTALYLPDIDRWKAWSRTIESVIETVDVAYLDGTFFANGELEGRDQSEIPHPTIKDSLARFAKLSERQRDKVRFFHFNHTNPALQRDSDAIRTIEAAGHHVARQGEIHVL